MEETILTKNVFSQRDSNVLCILICSTSGNNSLYVPVKCTAQWTCTSLSGHCSLSECNSCNSNRFSVVTQTNTTTHSSCRQ